MPSVYQCRACLQWFKRPTRDYACTCLPGRACPCHCGDERLTPTHYGDGTLYVAGGVIQEVNDA